MRLAGAEGDRGRVGYRGSRPGAGEEEDTVPHATGRARLHRHATPVPCDRPDSADRLRRGERPREPAGEGGDRRARTASGRLDELADAYAYPAVRGEPRPWLRANMVSTLDGAAQHEGRSQPISTAADMRIFGVLRALADVVVVGAETVRQEGYRPGTRAGGVRRRRGRPRAGARRRRSRWSRAGLDLDFTLPLFTAPPGPDTGADRAPRPPRHGWRRRSARARDVVIAGRRHGVDPARAVRALASAGTTRLLTEGGPRLLGQFVAAGVLDELCLTVAPMLTGGRRAADRGRTGARGAASGSPWCPSWRRRVSCSAGTGGHDAGYGSVIGAGVPNRRNQPFRLVSGGHTEYRSLPCEHGEGWFPQGLNGPRRTAATGSRRRRGAACSQAY